MDALDLHRMGINSFLMVLANTGSCPRSERLALNADAGRNDAEALPATPSTPADTSSAAVEDPDQEFASPADAPEPAHSSGPRIINVGLGVGRDAARWRRAWRDKILPALLNFGPDLILVSAGFDAHRHDDINMRYIGLQERDFEWVTDQIVQVSTRSTNIHASCDS